MTGLTQPNAANSEQQQRIAQVPEEAARMECTLTLRDGNLVRVRAIRADDTDRLRAFHSRLSIDSIIFRFFRVLPELSEELANRLTNIDYENRMALVATVEQEAEERIIAVVRYERTGAETGEVAFVVEDRWQGRGIATALLHRLADYARARGFTHLVAITMASNVRMLDVLRHCGFPCVMSYQDGDIEARLNITAPPVVAFTPCTGR